MSSDAPQSTSEFVTLAKWQTQLKLACEADRLEDIEAISALREPRTVVLRHVTKTRGRPRAEITGDTMLFAGGGERTTYRDELIRYAESPERQGCRPLPGLPPPGSPEAASLLRHLLREPHEFSGSCLFWVQSVEALRVLEAKGADTHDLGWMGVPLLVFMAERGDLPVVRFLIEERGHDPNAAREDGGYTALHWARGLDVVQYLIGRGADPNALTSFGDSVLAQQVRTRQTDVLDYLLGLGGTRASRANLLHWLDAWPETLRVLLRHGVDLDAAEIEATFVEHQTPRALHRVLHTGIEAWGYAREPNRKAELATTLLESVDLLLEHGCDPMRRDDGGRLPYHALQDLLPDPDEPLRRTLDERLARFDGPRARPPRKRSR